MNNEDKKEKDIWAEWIVKNRFGNNPDQKRRMLEALSGIRETVLKNASLRKGDTLLDVGCGDGLIGFGAFPIIGESGKVIFSDISEELLGLCREIAKGLGVSDQSMFVAANAVDLSEIESSFVDAVTTRSVLIYVKSKQAAFHEFYRVLKPGGFLSIFEPVAKIYSSLAEPGHYMGLDVRPIKSIMEKVLAVPKVSPNTVEVDQSAMSDFDDQDLIRMVREAGFDEYETRLNISLRNVPNSGGDWTTFLNSSPNPLAPTFGDLFRKALNNDEMNQLTACLKPQIESGIKRLTQAAIYMQARKGL